LYLLVINGIFHSLIAKGPQQDTMQDAWAIICWSLAAHHFGSGTISCGYILARKARALTPSIMESIQSRRGPSV
jgi:hypothetical protein